MDLTRRMAIGGAAMLGLSLPGCKTESMPAEPAPEPHASHSAMRARALAALPYKRVSVPGTEALAAWRRLKGQNRGCPVIVGGDADLARVADQFSIADPGVAGVDLPGMTARSPAHILAAAESIRFPADLRKWPGAADPAELHAPEGTWPKRVDRAAAGPSVLFDVLSRKLLPEVHILLLPSNHSWEVPAYLRWGDWNACPPAEYHVAALRHWHERFGAELVGGNGDTLDVHARPLGNDRAKAMALAREVYAYCPDSVDQGFGTIAALGAALSVEEWWSFWWD